MAETAVLEMPFATIGHHDDFEATGAVGFDQGLMAGTRIMIRTQDQ